MLHPSPLSRSAAAPLAGGYGATTPPVVPSAAARPPRAVASPSRERRLSDERPLFTAADVDWAEADAHEQDGRSRHDRWPEPGGEAFRALTDRDWRAHCLDANDDLPGPWFAIVVVSLIFGFTVAFGVGLARLVMVLL